MWGGYRNNRGPNQLDGDLSGAPAASLSLAIGMSMDVKWQGLREIIRWKKVLC